MYRQTRVRGVLLILQVVALVGFGAYLLFSIDWDRVMALGNDGEITVPKSMEHQVEQAIYSPSSSFRPRSCCFSLASVSCYFGAEDGCWPRLRRA